MKTSGDTLFPSRLTRIDELTRPDHSFLNENDECLYFGDYSARKGFGHSATNRLIINFKKPVDRRGNPEWRYKTDAIHKAAQAFSENLGDALSQLTLVPVPPSKIKSDPEYDDRVMDMLRAIRAPTTISKDIRELVVQTRSMPASHNATDRLPPTVWANVYAIDEILATPIPNWIGIIDDLLVTGCRFRAMSSLLRARFPEARITGLFIARRAPEAFEWPDLL